MTDPGSWQSVGWLIVGLAAVAAAVNQIWALIARVRTGGSDADAAHYATKEALDAMEGRLDRLETRFEVALGRLREEQRDDIGGLHDRISDLNLTTARMAGILEGRTKPCQAQQPPVV